MFPYLIDLGTFSVSGITVHLALPSYGVFFVAAMLTGYAVTKPLVRARFPKFDFFDYYWTAVLIGFLGAKVTAALIVLPKLISGQIPVTAVLLGGGVWLGGLIPAVLYSVVKFRSERNFVAGDFFNCAFVGIPFAHAVGRIGCLLGGCCYGGHCDLPWAITYTNPLAAQLSGTPLNDPRHPTPLYEAGVELLNGFICYRLLKGGARPWTVMATWLLLYGSQRFVIEFARGDAIRGIYFGLATSQWIAVAMVVIGALLWLRSLRETPTSDSRSRAAQPRPS